MGISIASCKTRATEALEACTSILGRMLGCMELMTITAISQQLGIPESTIRYYAKNHSEYLPAKGEGRKKRYSAECMDVLRFIAEAYKRNLTATEINDELIGQYPRIIESDNLPQLTTTTAQQQLNLTLQGAIMDLSRSLSIIADQQAEIKDLKARIEKLEQATATNTAISQQSFWSRVFKK